MTLNFAFLRAINVGKRRMAMADLAETLTHAGLTEVETFIASGNFVYAGHMTETQIETVLLQRFGFLTETFVRSRGELAAIHDLAVPHAAGQGVHGVQIGFLRDTPDDTLRAEFSQAQNDSDHFSFGAREVIWTLNDRLAETPFGKKGMAGKGWPVCTFRNVNTLGRMLEKWR